MKQGRRALQFIFASLMDICHLKNAELEAKHQKYKSRVVLRCDIVKDDSGSYAVFTEQGSSASQMTAAKNHGYHLQIAWLRWTSSRRSISLCPSKMENAHKLWKITKLECPDIWIRLPRHKWPKSWSSMEDPVVPLERNLYGRPLAGLLWERQFEKILLKKWLGRNFQIGNAYSHTVKKGYSYLSMWMASNWLQRNKTLIRCGKYSIKKLIWENQHLSLIMYTWVALNVNAK